MVDVERATDEEIEVLYSLMKKFLVTAMAPYILAEIKKEYIRSLPFHKRLKYRLKDVYDWIDYKIWCLKDIPSTLKDVIKEKICDTYE